MTDYVFAIKRKDLTQKLIVKLAALRIPIEVQYNVDNLDLIECSKRNVQQIYDILVNWEQEEQFYNTISGKN